MERNWKFFTTNTCIGIAVSMISTLMYWYFGPHITANMSWVIASMGLFFPITMAISMAFKRRDQALFEMGKLLGNLRGLWGALNVWKIQDKDTKKWVVLMDTLEECGGNEAARRQFDQTPTSIVAYFNHTRWRRARHSTN